MEQKENLPLAPPMPQRIIGHLDMDAFFAAVEERNNPRWRGLPIVVGADPRGGTGRGVVSTANYKAREFGIHSAQPITEAWRRAQVARARGQAATVFLSGDFSTYSEVSRSIMAIIKHHVPIMQQRSVDEAYFDLSFTGSFAAAGKLCQTIRQNILSQERLTATIGIGPNKLIAKIASDHNKPDGLTAITTDQVDGFLSPLPIRTIPGVGPKTELVLKRIGIATVHDAQQRSRQQLRNLLGKWGLVLYDKVRGLDSSPVREERVAKSIGRNHTFRHDTLSPQLIIQKVTDCCEHIMHRLMTEGFNSFRTVTVTVRFHDFETLTRAHTLPRPRSSLRSLTHEALRLLFPFFDHRENPAQKKIRLVGIRLEKIT